MSNPLAMIPTLLAADGPLISIWDWVIRNKPLLIVTGVAVLLAFVVSTIVARWVTRGVADEVRRHKARRTIAYLTQLGAMAVVLVTWAGKFNLSLLIGLASVGLALALQNVILCLAGWAKIVLRRPFDIGDRIQAGQHIGDVIDISLLHTYILEVGNWVDADQSTGRVAYIPNSVVFTQTVFNYTQGFPYIWHELPILVTFESDWRRARMILEDLAARHSSDMVDKVRTLIQRMKRNYPIRYAHLHPIVYTSVRDSGVLLTVRYLTEARERRQSETELCEEILEAFAKEPSINFAYPTYRMTGGVGLVETMTQMRTADEEDPQDDQ
ncbi:MAG: mechanosensitive ion channel [Anaerolineaceae bacterium]|nr:mechanosensitive ion channel [Anaerolineaceae bacterium]